MTREYVYQAPGSNAEFWERDGQFVFALVRKLLGPSVNIHDAEDAAAGIFERLLVARNKDGQGILEQYDAGKVSPRTGQPVTWRGFLSGKIVLYVRGKRESLARRDGRELLLCDTQTGDGGERWVDMFGGQIWDDYPSLTDAEFAQRMRDYLATLPDAWDGPVSLLAVFDEVVRRIQSGEKVTQLADLSRRQTREAMALLRAVAVRVPQQAVAPLEVAGVLLSPSEILDALERLRAAKGNHVHRALAGHRLMEEGAKGWYHGFARAELEKFPEIAVASREGKIGGAGAGHVKEAVMHGLQRLLAGDAVAVQPLEAEAAPVSEPEDVTRSELLEAELWRIVPGIDWKKVEAILAAVEKVYA